jgi:hypothetical protein
MQQHQQAGWINGNQRCIGSSNGMGRAPEQVLRLTH